MWVLSFWNLDCLFLEFYFFHIYKHPPWVLYFFNLQSPQCIIIILSQVKLKLSISYVVILILLRFPHGFGVHVGITQLLTNGPVSPKNGCVPEMIFTLTTVTESAVRVDAYRLRWCWRPPPSRWCHCALMSPWSQQWSPPSSSSQLLNWPGNGFPWRLLIPQHLMEMGQLVE